MKDILAFFGAFNQPSLAHLSLAEFALTRTGAKRVLFVPSKAAYIRGDQGKDRAYGDGERLAMLRLLAEERPWMEVTDLEIRMPAQPRTYETLCRLRDLGYDAALLLGSDKLPELEHKWLYVKEIAAEFGIVALTRGADECGRMIRESAFLSALPNLRVLETPADTRNISSTAIRRRVAEITALYRELETLAPKEILPLLWDPEPRPVREEDRKEGRL